MFDLDDLDKLEKQATPGPWKFGQSLARRCKDALLVCHLRNAAPEMILELRAARQRISDAFEQGRYDATREAYGGTAENYEKGLADGMSAERNRIADALDAWAKEFDESIDVGILENEMSKGSGRNFRSFAERLRKGDV